MYKSVELTAHPELIFSDVLLGSKRASIWNENCSKYVARVMSKMDQFGIFKNTQFYKYDRWLIIIFKCCSGGINSFQMYVKIFPTRTASSKIAKTWQKKRNWKKISSMLIDKQIEAKIKIIRLLCQ